MSQPALVVFHRADFDGVCSAAIVKKFVPDCELHGIDYGDLFPWEKVVGGPAVTAKELDAGAPLPKRPVYMVDFSLPPDDMKRLAEVSDLVWIDHHKVALHDCAHLDIPGVRSTGLAGCELTWEYFSSRNGEGMLLIPEAVRLLGRYDVWDSANPEWERIEAFQFGLRSFRGAYDPAHGIWQTLLGAYAGDEGMEAIRDIAGKGHAVLRYRNQEAKALCADGAHLQFLFPPGGPFKNQWANSAMTEGWAAICLNTLQRGSWLFDSVWDPYKHDVMCVYGKLKNGRWRVSLYSTKGYVDCGAICKAFGGGGHKGAAGFVADSLPWSDVPPATNGDRA